MPDVKYGQFEEVFKGRLFSILKRRMVINGQETYFEYCHRADSAIILPFDDKGRILLLKEYRYGPKRYVWFLPAGRVEQGNRPIKGARKELREETGYDAKEMKKICRISHAGSVIWDTHVFAARGLFKSPLEGDEHFPIKVVPTPWKKAVQMALDGTIEHETIAFHIIRFDYLLKHREWKWD